MRLDLFLKASRLCPRRTVAQKLCDAGIVFVNDNRAKSAHLVKAGDKIQIQRFDTTLTVKVLSVPTTKQTSRAAATRLYEVLSEEKRLD